MGDIIDLYEKIKELEERIEELEENQDIGKDGIDEVEDLP